MKKIYLFLFIVSFTLSGYSIAGPPNIKPATATNGVYVTYGWHNMVIELKDGKFRYWFSSDAQREAIEGLEGTYTQDGDKIVLKHPKLIPLVSNWTARSVDGVITLWRSDALKLDKDGKLDLYTLGKENFFRTGGGSILVPTKKAAQKAWDTPQVAVLSEEAHKAVVEKQKLTTAGSKENRDSKDDLNTPEETSNLD